MLDPWIIEEIRRREEERRRHDQQPAVFELPVHGPTPDGGKDRGKPEEAPRGVVIVELGVGCYDEATSIR